MTQAYVVPWEIYLGNGSQTVFPYPFRISVGSDLVVYDNATLTTAYTLTGVGQAGGGNVTFATAPLDGHVLFVVRQTPPTQLVDYIVNDPFGAETHEASLDKLTRLIQDLQEQLSRRPSLAQTTLNALRNLTLPGPGAGQVFGWNESGTALALYDQALLEMQTAGRTFGTTTATLTPTDTALVMVAEDLIPEGTRCSFVVYRCTTAFGTSHGLTSVDIGEATLQGRWGAGVGIAAATVTAYGQGQPGDFDALAATDVVVTANGGAFDATGACTLTAFWERLGVSGTPQATGLQGAIGPQGPPGSTGASGIQGPQGSPGVSPFLHVTQFGAVGDGVTDDTDALQDAIDAAGVTGCTLIWSAGVYAISSTLTVPYSNISLLGEATGYMFQSESPTRGTVLRWDGALDGAMLDVGPATPGPPYVTYGVTLADLTLDGNGQAGFPLVVGSVLNSVFRNLVIKSATTTGLTTAVKFPIATGFSVTDHCEFSNVHVIVTGDANGIVLDGYAPGGHNTTFCFFTNCSVVHEDGVAYTINYGDDNYFLNCGCSRVSGGTGHSIFLTGTNDGSGRSALGNMFLGFHGQGTIRAQGDAGFTHPSLANFVLFTSMDATMLVTIDSGASLYYLDVGGYTASTHPRMRLPGLETAEADELVDNRTAVKLLGGTANGNAFISVVGGNAGSLPQFAVPPQLPAYTVAGLATLAASLGVSNVGAQAYCTDLAGQAGPVYWDGIAWRRYADGTVAN